MPEGPGIEPQKRGGIGAGGKHRSRRIEVPALIWVGLVLAILLGTYGREIRYLNSFEWIADDLRVIALAPEEPKHPRVVVATIDENTILRTKRRSPIDRDFLARLFARLEDAKPAVIATDILFDRATTPDEDDALTRQLHQMTVPVLVADGNATTDANLITEDEAKFINHFVAGIDNPKVSLAQVHLPVDKDNVVRTAPALMQGGSEGYAIPSLSFGAVEATGWPYRAAFGRIAYYGFWDAKRGEPFVKLSGIAVVDAVEAAWAIQKRLITGKIVFVGSYLQDSDLHQTPFTLVGTAETPGVMIQATLAAQMIDQRWIRLPPDLELGVISVLIVLACFMIGVRSSNNWITVGAVSGVLLVIWTAAVLAYAIPFDEGRGRSLYPMITPAFAALIASWLGYALTRRQFAADRDFIRGALAAYVSESVARQLMEDPSLLSVGGDRREVSALFTDIEGFTTLSEELDPATLVDILNRYLEGMTAIVLFHEGMLDKYIGDAVVALWNADVPRPDHAAKAVACALEIARFAGEFAAGERERGIPFGRTRIGVQTGYAVVGNYGGARKLNFTAIGDTMNLTSRLEGANKHLGTTILVGGTAAERSGRSDLRPIARLVVKGKDEAVMVFGPAPSWGAERLERYRAAYALLDAEDPQAEAALRELADEHDPIIHLYLKRLAAGKQGTRIVLDEK